MSEDKNEKAKTKVILKDVRLSYPSLFKPKAFGKGVGQPSYQANFLIDKESKLGKQLIDAVDDAIEAAREAKWGSKQPKIKSDKICFKDGDKMEDAGPEMEGMMVLTARNYKKPTVRDRDKTELVEADGLPYGGCYVDASLNIWAQDNEYGIRINCSLNGVRFRRDGEAFGAGGFNSDDFEDLDDEDEKPRSRSKRDADDEDEDEKPRSRSKRDADDEDEDEDEKPRSRSKRDADDEEDRPSRNSRSKRDADDEDEKPRSRRSRNDDN